MIIAVSGAPGTGTTTLSRALSQRLGWPHFYAGQIFRDLAREKKLSLAQFSQYAEQHPEVDRELDRRLVETVRATPNAIVEGRMAVWHVQEAGVAALKVLLSASPEVRAKRVGEREGKDWQDVLSENAEREASETRRYTAIYGLDPAQPRHYGLVIDTTDKTPQAVQEAVLAALRLRDASYSSTP